MRLPASMSAFITGDTRLAVGIRGAFMRLAGRATHTITDKDNGALPLVRDHAPAFRVGGVIAAVIALVAINVTVASLLVVLVLLAVYEGLIAVLAVTAHAAGCVGSVNPAACRNENQ